MQITTERSQYTRWLLSRLGGETQDYILLFNYLNTIEFYWVLPNDSNRNADGLDVRKKYAEAYGDIIFSEMPGVATVFEVLCTMAERADWIIRSSPANWLTIFINNLGLAFLTDQSFTAQGEAFVSATIHKWLDRRFAPGGAGSPFRSSKYDLTKVSMWDSLQWYLADEFSEDAI